MIRSSFSFLFEDIGLAGVTEPMRTFDLLGTPLLATTYEQLIAHAHTLAHGDGTHAIDFTNTHIVTLRRQDRHFRDITSQFDHFVPDGMPLIWCLNARGAGLHDRVYGPTFMRRALEQSPAPWKHYLLGGSEECGVQLRARFPLARFVGSFHGQCDDCGILAGAAEDEVIAEINEKSPDFIWVGLGTPKQYQWIERHRTRLHRGVLFSVGFAFDVNAGLKRDAPDWMQRLGLTWVFRIASEPRRLLGRYLRYNSLFLYYLLKDALFTRRS